MTLANWVLHRECFYFRPGLTWSTLAHRAWSLKRSLDTATQTSHALTLPALLQVNAFRLSKRAAAWTEKVTRIEAKLTQIQTQIDQLVFGLYGIGESNRAGLSDSNSISNSATDASSDEDEDDNLDIADLPFLISELLAYALGVALGSFDVRLAIGDHFQTAEPEPFAPLPICSPGMLNSIWTNRVRDKSKHSICPLPLPMI